MQASRFFLRTLVAGSAVLWAADAPGQSASRDPHIGYIFPAGGKSGGVVTVLVGGQYLRNVRDVHISGDGISGEFVKYYRPIRNLNGDQRKLLNQRIKARRAELMPQSAKKAGKWKKGGKKAKLKPFKLKPKAPPSKLAPKPKTDAKTPDGKKKEPEPEPPPVVLPDHPLIDNIDNMSLKALAYLTDTVSRYNKKRQPNAQIAEMAAIEMKIDRSAAPGDREIRLVTGSGLTNAMIFQVGGLPEINEEEPNDPDKYTQYPLDPPFNLPKIVNGQIMPGDVDHLRFRARKGTQLVIQAQARRLIPYLADAVPGWFQLTMTLFDSERNELAYVDDFRFDPDPVLLYEIPEDGIYTLEIRDSIYRGREDFVYRVAVGEIPFITAVYPLGGRKGTLTVAGLAGWNLPKKSLPFDTNPGGDAIRYASLTHRGHASNAVPYAVDALPDVKEVEPNDSPKNAQPVKLPGIVNGQIGLPGDIDVFRVRGRRGAELVAEVAGRRLNSPIDSLIRVTDIAGNVLALNDDLMEKDGHLHRGMGLVTHHADSYARVRLPADGVYYVQLEDAQGHGGVAYSYRLRLSPPRPDFVLRASPATLNVKSGTPVPMTIHVLRKDGFNEAIEIRPAEGSSEFKLTGATIPPGASKVHLTLEAPVTKKKKKQSFASLRLEGVARAGGMTEVRPVAPADNQMQAFLWRHLVPTRELLVMRSGKGNKAPVSLASPGAIEIPAGGEAGVRVRLPAKRAFDNVAFKLRETYPGLSLETRKGSGSEVRLVVKAEADKVPVGAAGNLILEATADRTYTPNAKEGEPPPKPKTQRISLGVLPAVPYVVVKPSSIKVGKR